jgi:hypothetical protein
LEYAEKNEKNWFISLSWKISGSRYRLGNRA